MAGKIEERKPFEKVELLEDTLFKEQILKKNCLYTIAEINEVISIEAILESALCNLSLSYGNRQKIVPEDIPLIKANTMEEIFLNNTQIPYKIFNRMNSFSKHFLVALDCEMMICAHGKQVGRVSIVDSNGLVLYDKYIKPRSRVLDYLEFVSGLNLANTSSGIYYEELQRDISKIIGSNTYIVGHGLDNDLEALEISHDKIIDTALLWMYTDRRKFKLSQLMCWKLETKTQGGVHSSIDDARSALKLLEVKVAQIKEYLANKKAYAITKRFVPCLLKTDSEIQKIEEKFLISSITKEEFKNLKLKKEWEYFFFFEENGKMYFSCKQST